MRTMSGTLETPKRQILAESTNKKLLALCNYPPLSVSCVLDSGHGRRRDK